MKALLLAFLMALGLAGAVEAREVRWPDAGTPAITVEVPDGWNSRPDTAGVNLILSKPASGMSFSIYVGKVPEAEGDLSALAAAVRMALGSSAQDFTKLSDGTFRTYRSEVYRTVMSREGNVADVELTLLRIDPATVSSISMLTGSIAQEADKQQARTVFDSIRVIAQ